jgi:phage-related protein
MPAVENSLQKYSHLAILGLVKVAFYETASGRSPLEDFIKDLPKADQARFADVFDGIEKYGLGCPRVQFRQLRGKLWEVKFNTPSGGYRIGYVVVEADTMVWLHAFKKKTQKTPSGDLEIAEKRMKEVLGL